MSSSRNLPLEVITDLAVLGFDEKSKRMRVESLNPGVTFEKVQENTSFEIRKAESITDTKPPTEAELCILREQVDPDHYVIGR